MNNPPIYRRKLDNRILDSLTDMISSYIGSLGIENADLILKKIEEKSQIYIENLEETSGCFIQSRFDEIAIDKSFVSFDESERIIGLNKNIKESVIFQIIHEIIHTENENTNDHLYLNDGFRQIITENITGYSINLNPYEYNIARNIAKILQATLGEQYIVDSYFNNNADISSKCISLSGINSIQKVIDRALIQYNNYSRNLNRAQNIYKRMNYEQLKEHSLGIIYDIITLDIIVPRLQSLSSDQIKQYLDTIVPIVQDKPAVEKKILSLVPKYSRFGQKDRLVETQRHIDRLCSLSKREIFMNDIFSAEKWQEYMVLNENDGTIHPKSESAARIGGILEEKAFYEMYLQENGYYSYDNNQKVLIPGKYQELVSSVMKMCNAGTANIRQKSSSISQRKMYLSMLKNVGLENGYLFFNSLDELTNSNNINVKCVRIPSEINKITYEDIKKMKI